MEVLFGHTSYILAANFASTLRNENGTLAYNWSGASARTAPVKGTAAIPRDALQRAKR